MSLKLVAIDLDATLLRDDKSYDIERFDYLVNKLVDQGTQVMIASGNSNRKIKSYLSNDTLEKVYLGGDNGNDIEKAGKHIRTNVFPHQALIEISALVDADDELQMVVNTPEYSYSKYIYEKDRAHIEIFNPDIKFIDSYDEIKDRDKPVKAAILSSKSLEATKELVDKIENEIKGVSAVTSGGGWLDAYSEKGGKGSAVKWLQEEKNISESNTMTFGDSLNDSSMMKYAHYSVAMENADDDLKDLCQYVIGHNEEQAVLNVLEKYVQTGSLEFMENHKK